MQKSSINSTILNNSYSAIIHECRQSCEYVQSKEWDSTVSSCNNYSTLNTLFISEHDFHQKFMEQLLIIVPVNPGDTWSYVFQF